MDLTGTTLRYAAMSSANLAGANLSNADFGGAGGIASGGSTATYNLTICPDLIVTSAGTPTCVGHGFSA